MRLLIVDDDKFTCRGIQLRIQNMNLKPIQEIHMAFSGEEALAFARENPVDILLTDIKMVNMNGLELIRRVKELHPHVCSLILTAYASFPYAQQAIELGVIGFLLKPCGKEEMEAMLQKAIAQREASGAPTETPPPRSPILWAQTYVQQHLSEKIDMVLVANELDLSYSYFSKLFKQETGQSFSSYIIEEKMKEAGQQVLAGRRTGQIARDLGYQSPQNFNRTFVRYYQCTPGEYRRRKMGGETDEKE